MRGADTLIQARFLTLTSHLSAVITLIWQSQECTRHCLPSHFHDDHFQTYHNRLVAGFGSSLALILLEFFTFLSGLTMFSPAACLISVAGHGAASIALLYFVLDHWLCDWYWPVFVLCSALPSIVDVAAALPAMCTLFW